MATATAKELIEQGDDLFSKRATLMSLWQEIANNFYIERADFIVTRTMGITFGENLMTSYPLIARRELGNQLGAMLRPKNQEWKYVETTRMDKIDNPGKQFLYYSNEVMRRAMYDPASGFIRATKEGDHDFAAFGQCVVYVDVARNGNTLLYQGRHLRDVAWCENEDGFIDTVHCKWKNSRARDVVKRWPATAGQKMREINAKTPYQTVELRHIIMPSELYDAGEQKNKKLRRFKYVSIWIDAESQEILEETGSRRRKYVIPRWQTVSGSQYAYSPATVAGLPDARLLQAITLTLLEAGEKFTNPPMVAVQEALRSDVQVFAGGITMVDSEYDERTGEVLRPLTQDRGGMPLGRDIRNDIVSTLAECFYLNKLSGPPQGGPEKTAFQVGQEVQQYIRDALPLFEPMEQDYNGGLCEETFELLLHENAFGPISEIPPSVLGSEIQFRFDSPLTQALEVTKVAKLAQGKEMLAQVVDVEPGAVHDIDWRTAFRDAMEGNKTPATWIRSKQDADEMARQQAKAAMTGAVTDQLQKSANIVKTLSDAGQNMSPAAGAEAANAAGPSLAGAAAA